MNVGRSPDGPLLSIVTPFFNSADKADRLLKTLSRIHDPDVELILVDDGSTDDTYPYLRAHAQGLSCRSILTRQENKGPGGARNHGLELASGRYVWFADSDDDIDPAAISIVRDLAAEEYDFIDFDVEHFRDRTGRVRPSEGARAGALALREGAYCARNVTRLFLLRSIGWLWTKVFRKGFLTAHGVRYPEYCVYEDSLLFFWLPLIVERFYKSSHVAYFHHQEHESVTRSSSRKGPRFYDRLPVAAYGVDLTRRFDCTPEERLRIEGKFRSIFLLHTVKMLYSSGDWWMIPRVMKYYREEAMRLGIRGNPMQRLAIHRLAALMGPWLMSYFYGPQKAYFEHLHLLAWQQPIAFPPEQIAHRPVRFTPTSPCGNRPPAEQPSGTGWRSGDR